MITMNTTYFHIIIQARGHSLPPYTGQIAEWALLQCIDVSKPRVPCAWQHLNKYKIYTASDVVPRVCCVQLVVYFHYLLPNSGTTIASRLSRYTMQEALLFRDVSQHLRM